MAFIIEEILKTAIIHIISKVMLDVYVLISLISVEASKYENLFDKKRKWANISKDRSYMPYCCENLAPGAVLLPFSVIQAERSEA